MNLKTILKDKKMSIYKLSKISSVPYSTISDICLGKSKIESCSARTIYNLAKALDMKMEDLMMIDNDKIDEVTGKPKDNSYLERGLPDYLVESIKEMKKSWEKIDSGIKDLHWDIYWCNLYADINSAETDELISSEAAWYLREKYLRMEK